MPTPLRMKRINDRFREVLHLTLTKKTKDPRTTGVHVTDVRMDSEQYYATIAVSA